MKKLKMVNEFSDLIKKLTAETCHTEIKIDGEEVKIIESRNRIGGGYVIISDEDAETVRNMPENIIEKINVSYEKLFSK